LASIGVPQNIRMSLPDNASQMRQVDGTNSVSFWFIASFLPSNDSSGFLCNFTDPVFLGAPRFPLDATNYTVNGTIETSCFASNISVPPVSCNEPLSLIDGGCSFTCPLPSLTDDQYLGAKIMQGIVGWFSWVRLFSLHISPTTLTTRCQVASATLIVSYLFNPQLRRFPKGLILMTAMAANVLVPIPNRFWTRYSTFNFGPGRRYCFAHYSWLQPDLVRRTGCPYWPYNNGIVLWHHSFALGQLFAQRFDNA